MADNIRITKNNCITVHTYTANKFSKFKKALIKSGYREVTDVEYEKHLKDNGFVQKGTEVVEEKPKETNSFDKKLVEKQSIKKKAAEKK